MKKVFIGLLILAAGAGTFYFLQKKKSEGTIEKELLTGKWKLSSIDVKTKDSSDYYREFITSFDSNSYKYRYDFRKDGNVTRSLVDSVNTDTLHYAWTKKNELSWKENVSDSLAGDVFSVSLLTRDSLVMLSKDSAIYVFTKLK